MSGIHFEFANLKLTERLTNRLPFLPERFALVQKLNMLSVCISKKHDHNIAIVINLPTYFVTIFH